MRKHCGTSLVGLSALAAVLLTGLPAGAATLLPVGPITFSSNADYDSNFKEGTLAAIGRDSTANRLRVQGNGGFNGIAVFDTSATGGSGGNGGTGGADANNDLADFTVSAIVNVTNRTPNSTSGFLLRLDDNEQNGYLATVTFETSGSPPAGQTANAVRFRLYEGFGIDTAAGSFPAPIYNSGQIAAGTVANTDFAYAVTANGAQFDFSFNNGAVTASFTDPTLSRTVGQVGIRLATDGGASSQSRMDNFSIAAIPEPATTTLVIVGLAGATLLRRRRR